MFTIFILPNPSQQPFFCLQAWAWQNLPRSAFEVWVLLPEGANKAEFDWPTGLSGGILSPKQVPRLGAPPDREILIWEADFLPHRDLLWQLKAARSHSPTGLLQTVGTWPRPVPPAWQAVLKESDLALPFAPDAFESRALAPDQVFCSGLLLPERDFQALLDAQPEFLTAAMAPMRLQALRHWLHTHLPAPSQTVFLIPSARATCIKPPAPSLPLWAPPPCPLKLLVGPLPDPALLGDYLYSPQVKTFTARPCARLLSQVADYPLEAYNLSFDLNQAGFEDLLSPWPPEGRPDLILWLAPAVQGLPPGIEKSPVPVVALAHDWHSHGLATLLDCAADFDWLFGDHRLEALLRAEGHSHVSYWPCYGLDPERSYALPKAPRRYAIGFVGTLTSPYYPERERLLADLARLAERWPVLLADGIRDPHIYNRLLHQCQIVLNPTARGEMNLRAYEAAAAGALLVSEADNREIRRFLPEGEAAIFFEAESLTQTLEKLLADPARVARLAQNGQTHIQEQTYTAQFGQLLSQLQQRLPEIRAKRQAQQYPRSASPAISRTWLTARQLYFSRTPGGRERAEQILAQALTQNTAPVQPRLSLPEIRLLKQTQALFQINQAIDFAQAESAGQAQKPLWSVLSQQQKTALREGLQRLAELMAEAPSPFLAYHLGWAWGYVQDYGQARPYLQKALNLAFPENPRDPDYRLILPLGHSSRQIPHFQMAYARRLEALCLQASPSAWPLQALILSQIAQLQGHALRAEQRPDLAQEAYLAALQLYPESPELQWLIAQSALESGQPKTAERVLANLVTRHPLTFPYRWAWLKLLKALKSEQYRPALQASIQLFKGLSHPGRSDFASALAWLEAELKS